MSRIVPIFAGRSKRLRVDCANSHQTPTPRRGFLATVAASLGLTARPVVADEWIVSRDGDAEIAAALDRFMDAHDAYRAFGIWWDEHSPSPTQAIMDQRDARHEALRVAYSASRDDLIRLLMGNTPCDPPPSCGRYSPSLPFCRRRVGNRLVMLVRHAEVVGEGGEWGPDVMTPDAKIEVIVCNDDAAMHLPSSPGIGEEDATLAAALARYLTDLDASTAAALAYDAANELDDAAEACAAEARHNRGVDALAASKSRLIALMEQIIPPAPPLACGGYAKPIPFLRRRLGDHMVCLRLGGVNSTSLPADLANERVELVIIPID